MRIRDLGTDVPYAAGMAAMRDAIARVDADGPVLLLLEHTPVITTTRRGGMCFVRSAREEIEADGIDLVETDRGGDVTYHGPGQIVGYPVLRLRRDPLSTGDGPHGRVVDYVRALESGLVSAARAFGLDARGDDDARGVWVGDDKLCAIGVGVGRGVTRHGFAFNVDIDLPRYTKHIVPCGLVGRGVTSLERLGIVRADAVDVISSHVVRALAPFLTTLHVGAVHG